jgi:hypothetical protein
MPTLHLQVCAGFANRVRAMVSGICLAKHYKIPLVLHWYPRPDECGCEFEHVIDPKSLPSFVKVTSQSMVQAEEVLSHSHAETLLQTWDHRSDLKFKSYGIFYSDETWDTVLRSLRPSPSVRQILDARCSQVDWAKAIGVHIRRTDNKKSIEGSPTEWFLDKMRQGKDSVYIVATDDVELRDELQNEFGTRCVFPASVVSRWFEEGMIHGVADFFALSKCSRIWGSVGSSFSEIAARYGSTELILS